MKHLTSADYTRQPWKNGKGETVEMWRAEKNGQLLARLSRATVTEDGAFSVFPAMNRNLTVLTGSGFRLIGSGLDLACKPLRPVAFAGDVAVAAHDTHDQPSDDFNVMTAAHLPLPEVCVMTKGVLTADGGLLALYALGAASANGVQMAPQDLIVTDQSVAIIGQMLVTRLHLS